MVNRKQTRVREAAARDELLSEDIFTLLEARAWSSLESATTCKVLHPVPNKTTKAKLATLSEGPRKPGKTICKIIVSLHVRLPVCAHTQKHSRLFCFVLVVWLFVCLFVSEKQKVLMNFFRNALRLQTD